MIYQREQVGGFFQTKMMNDEKKNEKMVETDDREFMTLLGIEASTGAFEPEGSCNVSEDVFARYST